MIVGALIIGVGTGFASLIMTLVSGTGILAALGAYALGGCVGTLGTCFIALMLQRLFSERTAERTARINVSG